MTRSLNLLGLSLPAVYRSALLFILAITSPFFLATPAQAETPTKLYGVVTDSEGAAIPGVGISVVGPDGFSAYVSTD